MAGLGKGSGPHFLFFPPPSSEVTHVVMEGTSAEEAVCQQERRTAALHPGCTRPVLLDVSWFTESMAAGQPVPVECRHCLEVSWVKDEGGAPKKAPAQAGAQLGQVTPGDTAAVPQCPSHEVGGEGSAQTTKGPWEARPFPLLLSPLVQTLLRSTYL